MWTPEFGDYAEHIETCQPGMCRDGLFACVERLGPGPDVTDPACQQASSFYYGVCDGAVALSCSRGYVIGVRDCGTGMCAIGVDGLAQCRAN